MCNHSTFLMNISNLLTLSTTKNIMLLNIWMFHHSTSVMNIAMINPCAIWNTFTVVINYHYVTHINIKKYDLLHMYVKFIYKIST